MLSSESVTLKDLVMVGMEGFGLLLDLATLGILHRQLSVSSCVYILMTLLLASLLISSVLRILWSPASSDANSGGGLGCLIDKSIYFTSNASMLFDSFTQFHDGGVGFWCKDLGNAEMFLPSPIIATLVTLARVVVESALLLVTTLMVLMVAYHRAQTLLRPHLQVLLEVRDSTVYDENLSYSRNDKVVQGEDDGNGNIDYSPSNANYALALILYVQDEYLIIGLLRAHLVTVFQSRVFLRHRCWVRCNWSNRCCSSTCWSIW